MIETNFLENTREFKLIKLFLLFTDITAILVYLILILLVFIMIKVPLQGMGFLRYFLYFNIAISLVFETLLVSLKPLILFPFAVIYPIGWLSPLNSISTLIIATFALDCLAIFVDILLSMLAQRYFFTRLIINKNYKWIQYVFYLFLWITNLIACFSCTFILSFHSSSPQNISELISNNYSNGIHLLSHQPSLTGFMDYSSSSIIFLFRIIVFFAISRIFAIIFLTFLNYRLLNKNSDKWTLKTQKMLQMFLKSIYAQAAVLILAGGGPGILTIVLFIIPNLPFIKIFWMFTLWCAFFFSFIQTCAFIIFTPPFLNFLKKRWHLAWKLLDFSRPQASIRVAVNNLNAAGL